MRAGRVWAAGVVAAGLAAAGLAALRSRAESLAGYAEARRPAAMYPEYAGTVIPPNIAPLNFEVREPGEKYCVRVSAAAGAPIEVFSAGPRLRFPAEAWRALLQANAGGELRIDIFARRESRWSHFETVRNRIAAEEIDPYVVYRYLPPVYDKWGPISIRQRDLATFDERVLIDNTRSVDPDGRSAGGGCFNCHTFLNHAPDQMLLHFRPGSGTGQGPAMVLARGGKAEKIDTRVNGRGAASYASWHPSGKLIAFSRNSLLQIFHTAGPEVRDVIDRDSDLALYEVDSGRMYTVPQISRPDRLETWPNWSADGRYLYFSSARTPTGDKKDLPLQYDKVRYDLARVSFDPAAGSWGDVETVVSSEALGRSISLPVVSPDGHYLMFTGHEYGSFPIFQPSSDLYLLDLRGRGGPRRIDEINSDRADSYHSWSSNSHWVIFSSKREDGMFARLFISHTEGDGRFGRPFVLPQEDPGFYARCLMTFNRPELITKPVPAAAAELTRAINSTARQASHEAAPPAAAGSATDEPYQGVKAR